MESNLDFRNIVDHCPFIVLQDSLMRLETKLDKASTSEWSISNIELSDPQSEINENLKTLAPLLTAFYRDWIRIRQSSNFNCRSYLLGHLAREIAAGFRDILSLEKDEGEIKMSLKNENLGGLKEHKPHIASIMSALGVPDFDLRASQWINITKDLATLAHKDRNEHERSIRRKSGSLWPKFEELLAFLVGGYINLLNGVDKILDAEQPNENMIGTLRDLLKPEVLNKYFFQNLKSSAWLKPLKQDGWFNPENNHMPREDPTHPGYYYTSRWYALEYVVKVANYTINQPCDETFGILVDIVNDIVKSAGDHRNRINNKWTDWQTIKIISTLPMDQIKCRHITFMGIALKTKWKSGLVDQEIVQKILPKLLDAGAKELTLTLLKVMFDSKVVEKGCDPEITEAAKESTLDLLRVMFGPESVNREIIADVETYEPRSVNREITYMQEHCLMDALKEHGESIAKLCGIKAADIALEQIRILIAEGVTSFDYIQLVRTEPADVPRESYAELLVGFVSRVWQFAETTTIAQMLEDLLQAPQTIIRRMALTAVTHHYSDLKRMFWEWKGNPLEEVSLKPELYQLIQINCTEFKESEIEQILDWIELAQYTAVFAKDNETRVKVVAYKKREWLLALMETDNQKVISAYRKYEHINQEPIEHPGFLRWTEIWAGRTSPLTIEELSAISNAQIAEYLANFKEPKIVIKKSDPTEEGLAKTLKKCVASNPQRFTNDLQPFQNVKNFYQHWLLHGFLEAWRNKEEFDWTALIEFICQILLSKRFWTEQHTAVSNYRQWTLIAIAELITSGTESDKHGFDERLLPLVERILLILVETVEPGDFSCINHLSDIPSLDRSKVFSGIINYTLRLARTSDTTQGNYQWPQTIRDDFTRRLSWNVEPSLEFFYMLGVYLPYLSDLDEEWVVSNLQRIFPKENEFHWQVAFSGYLLHSGIYEDLYVLFTRHGHYQKALNTDFADDEVIRALVEHICIGWIQDWETLDDDTSLIYQLIEGGAPEIFSAVVHFFLEQRDKLQESDEPEKVKAYEKVKAKVKPAWRALFGILSQHSEKKEYQAVLSPLSMWLGLIDKIDDEVRAWIKVSMNYLDKVPGYAFTLSSVIEALQKHVLITPEKVGKIYLEIPKNGIRFLGQTQKSEVEATIRILYKKGHKDIADGICNRFGKVGADFLRSVYEESKR